MNMPIQNLIIIGSGPAGLTAAIYATRANLQPLIIEGPMPGGQLMGTSIVENWPATKKITGPELMMNTKEHVQSLGAEFLSESVVQANFTKKPFTLETSRNKTFKTKAIIIATGATHKRLEVPGESEYWGKGITTCAVCDGSFYRDKEVVVIGGGDTAMEDASFLKRFTSKITIIQNLDVLTASPAMQQKIHRDPDITIMYNSVVTSFEGTKDHLTKAVAMNRKTNKQVILPIDGAFVAIGMKPNSLPFQANLELDKNGFISVRNHTKTSVAGVFAAGDVADYRYRQAITAAAAGCMAALDAQRYLEEQGTK